MKLDHIGIATNNLDEGSVPYLSLGLEPSPDELIEKSGVWVRVFATENGLIELISPAIATSSINKFLAKRGPGLHHIAFSVDKLDQEIKKLESLGAQLIGEPHIGRAGSLVVFLQPKFGAGTLIELVQHAH